MKTAEESLLILHSLKKQKKNFPDSFGLRLKTAIAEL